MSRVVNFCFCDYKNNKIVVFIKRFGFEIKKHKTNALTEDANSACSAESCRTHHVSATWRYGQYLCSQQFSLLRSSEENQPVSLTNTLDHSSLYFRISSKKCVFKNVC